jgi:uncharacterized protein (TIGR02453 family)
MDLIADLSTALARLDIPLHGDPKRSLFRINRDVRFARDKSPYKTTVSAVLSRSGDKRDQGIVYFQHGLESSFAAAGFYRLDPPELSAFRHRIVAHQSAWRQVEADLEKSGLRLSQADAASRLPKSFTAENVGDLAGRVKLKSYTVSTPLSAEALSQPELIEDLARFAQAAMPLLTFGWRALEG